MSEADGADRDFYLGIEGGGTKTVAILADGFDRCIRRAQAGPSNLRLVSDEQLIQVFSLLTRGFPKARAVGIGLAGVRDERDEARVLAAASRVWPDIPARATHDLEIALQAAGDPDEAHPLSKVIVLSGTGSCCFGSSARGSRAKIGGWGHIIGDKGSGFEIGLRALKAVVYYLDRDGTWSLLGQTILSELLLNEPNELIGWVQQADKSAVAALAKTVFECAKDPIARDILKGAAASLARDAVTCASRLARKKQPVRFIFSGSIVVKEPKFREAVTRQIAEAWPNARFEVLDREAAWGAVRLAQGLDSGGSAHSTVHPAQQTPERHPIPASKKLPPTEQRNPRSMNLDKLSIRNGIELMVREEARIGPALLKVAPQIEETIGMVAKALKAGGRLFYCGAGTSGRLGVLDASECPPTFRTPPDLVQGIMAGGQRALWRSIEGAEDDFEAGARAIEFRRVRSGDMVIGIAASGRTPFVWGALDAARKVKAATALICFNPDLEIDVSRKPDVIICPAIGPELLTGSTRLKAGTATKQILNMITTLAMVRMGKVISNLMIDLNPSNSKLRDRAIRILVDLGVGTTEEARELLEASGWVIKEAWQKAKGTGAKRRSGTAVKP